MLRGRALVEFLGGPADGARRHVHVYHETGEPSPVTYLRRCGSPGLPVVTEDTYDLRPAPPEAEVAWYYVVRNQRDD